MDGIQVNGAQTLFEIGPIAITQTVLSMIVVTATDDAGTVGGTFYLVKNAE